VLGVLPYLHGLYLDAEDALPRAAAKKVMASLRVVAPVYPRISNHNDLDPLRFHPEVDFRFVGPNDPPPPCDLIVLPGSKAVQADLAWLRAQGWEEAIRRHLRYGGKLIGICGGLQMLGRQLHDPLGLEGPPGSAPGLAWLDYETRLATEKKLENVSGELLLPGTPAVAGYRIHMGVTRGAALLEAGGHPRRPSPTARCQTMARFWRPTAMACSILRQPLPRLLAWAGHRPTQHFDAYAAAREQDIERLADAVEENLDLQPAGRVAAGAGDGLMIDSPFQQGLRSWLSQHPR
jgi:adenosylcobyric acid synthase